jgi:hypothetical protein
MSGVGVGCMAAPPCELDVGVGGAAGAVGVVVLV